MSDSHDSLSANQPTQSLTVGDVKDMLDERFDIEALAQMVEHRDFTNKLSQNLTTSFNSLRSQSAGQGQTIQALQQEIRDLILDVALLKRALVSTGQVGVMERRKIERELVREVLPPSDNRPGTGVVVIHPPKDIKPQPVDCASRLHICKAACCRIFKVHLTPEEVDMDVYEWDPRQPYALRRNRTGCVHLAPGACSCAIYDSRPTSCRGFNCSSDKRIWEDFDQMVLNPSLKQRLELLQTNTSCMYGKAPGERMEPSPEPLYSSHVQGADSGWQSQPDADETPPTAAQSDTNLRPGTSKPDATEQLVPRTIEPPNFDDLRNALVNLPKKRFVPPAESSQENAADSP